MDLHFHGPEPTAAERAAVDSVLGPPTSAWAGGARNVEEEGHSSLLGGHAARSRRDLLLPALHAVQSRFGWIPPGALDYICRRLTVPPAEAHGVVTFYHLFSLSPRPLAVAHVCDDIACRIKGAERLCAELEQSLGPESEGRWKRSPCLGRCEQAPAALGAERGRVAAVPISLAPATTADIVAARASEQDGNSRPVSNHSVNPCLSSAARRSACSGRIGRVDPESLDAYRASGGYAALARAIEIGPEGVIREVLASKLMGRGGAAFPTGRKWDAVAKAPARPHYVVCNADESEPGTFKDRVLMEGDPFAVLEGMTIAGFATGSERGYLYVRGEYPLATRRMGAAIDAARAAGLLGENIMNAGFAFDVELRSGAGAYICGEETALFNSIEGKRGEPRNKPPFPVQAGLFGKPTVINNVETLVNIPPDPLAGRRGVLRHRDVGLDRAQALLRFRERGASGRLRGRFRHLPGRSHRDGGRGPRREGDPRGAARRGRGNVRGAGQAGDPPDLRGNARGGRVARLGRGAGLRRIDRPRRHPRADRGVLPR